MNYYNENNLESAVMLEQLIIDGHIPRGHIDVRSIEDIQPGELEGYKQCHFFAGIGGWPMALRLAGWPEDKPVWTGSCPCQPFSVAGEKKGKADKRHLWPVWERLIRECRPPTIFGEQVANAIAKGWLDDVYAGLEESGYAVGSAVLPACSVGAPHRRNRLWFVADSRRIAERCEVIRPSRQRLGGKKEIEWPIKGDRSTDRGSLGNSSLSRLQGHGEPGEITLPQGRENPGRHAPPPGVWLDCPGGKKRLAKPSIPMLVDGFQRRRPILHAIGNAIVPQVAAEFIMASV